MNLPQEHLYNLLPSIYREKDFDRGELRSLLAIIEQELGVLEDNIGDLYEDWFIETCADWVVPYIGDLLGVSGIGSRSLSATGQQSTTYGQQERRAFVANTLAYRRRKGTAPVVEQLARDVTGWRARAVEFFDRLAIAQNINHIRPNNTTVNLRNTNQLRLLGSPFEQQVAYSAEVHERGKYNIPNIGLFLWRLQSYPITKVNAKLVQKTSESLRERCFTFSPLNNTNIPLFNPPQTETEITQLAEEINVPDRLRPDPNYVGYQGEQPAFQIFINGSSKPIPPQEVLITDLLNETTTLEILQTTPAGEKQLPKLTKVVAVNPKIGRLAFLDAQPPKRVEVTYAYGFSHDIGGGSYDRSDSIAQVWSTDLTALDQESHSEDEPIQYFSPLYWEIEQARSGATNPLAEAVDTWNGTVQAWQGLHDLKCIPLTRVPIPRTQAVQTPSSQPSRPRFRPGIVSGFNTIASVGTPEFVVNPGLAVDALGRAIDFDQSVLIRLNELDPKLLAEPVIWVVVSYWSNPIAPNYQFNLIPHSQIEQYPENTYIRITGLSTDMQGNVQQQYEPQTFPFRIGIVEGLTIITLPGTLEAIVTPGKAVDQLGRPILLDRNIPIDLRAYQNRTVTLAIAYSEESEWQIYVLLKEDLDRNSDNYPSGIYIRLAELSVPVVRFAEQPPTPSSLKLRPRFKAGIIQGLAVQAKPGARMVIIKAGKAIDQNACEIEIEKDYPLGQLGAYRGQTVTLVIAYRPEPFGLNWELKILRAKEVANYPVDRYLQLAQLQISWTGKLTASPIDLRQKFKPGIVQGLDIEPRSFAKVKVNAGKAVDRLGQVVCLEEACELDLSKHSGRDLVIFISSEKRQGWKPLDVQTNDIGQSWQHIGVTPIEPETKEKRNTNKMGVILIKDNHTYNGNLNVVIPSSEFLQTKLNIIAANGYRPHIQGNLSIQGTVPNYAQRSTLFEPGQLSIDGLLIEGKVTVEPGDLKHLEIAHCTLVPRPKWGLEVKAAQPLQPIVLPPVEDCSSNNEADEEQESWGLIAIIIYAITVLSQLIRLGFSPNHLSPQQRLRVLVQFAQKEFETLWCALQEDLYQCQRHEQNDSDSSIDCFCLDPTPGNPGQNRELSIALDHSICGLIRLPESVLKLSIQDSIIDRGVDSAENSQGTSAIAAAGAMVTVQTSTILGTTKSRSIQASNSIFDQIVSAIDQQVGCLRFCYVPLGSRTPARYRCQPDLALQEIPTLPPAITALAITTLGDLRFLGTAGKGVFALGQQTKPPEWKQTSLTDHTISALITYIRNRDVLLAGTSTGMIFESRNNGETWSATNIENNLEVTALAAYTPLFQDATLFAGTAGNGVFKFNSQTDEWESMGSDSLTQQNVTSLAIDTSGRIFVGTDSGVFRWSKKSNRWRLIGLEDQSVTAFTIDSDERIFAGTQEGQVFRSTNHGDRWTSVSKTLSGAPITSLVVQSVLGNAMLDGLVLRGEDIHPLREGSAVTIQGQTRVIQRVKFDPKHSENAIEAIVDSEFCPELSGAVAFSSHFLFAGTSGSGIYRSLNQGDRWISITSASHLADQNITALAIGSNRSVIGSNHTTILAGTAIGSVLSSDDRGNRWSPLNRGLNDVDQVLPLLTQIQPIFTSLQYEQPGYVQLSQTCAQDIRRGAEDGSEMGAFNALKQPQREDNLRALLKEYVRFGLKAELFYMT